MKNKNKRLLFIIITFLFFGVAISITLTKLQNNISFFYTTSELLASHLNNIVRVGGVVVKNSIKTDVSTITFKITDFHHEIKVVYNGILPPLFSDNTTIVAKGKMKGDIFIAEEILAKHDENYMPKKYKNLLKLE